MVMISSKCSRSTQNWYSPGLSPVSAPFSKFAITTMRTGRGAEDSALAPLAGQNVTIAASARVGNNAQQESASLRDGPIDAFDVPVNGHELLMRECAARRHLQDAHVVFQRPGEGKQL